MMTADYERDLVLGGKLPGLLGSCTPDFLSVHDSVASFLCPDTVVHSFPRVWFWFLLSLLCVYTWMTLVSFLARIMDLSGSSAVTAKQRSFDSKISNRVNKAVRPKKKAHDRHAFKARKMQEKLQSPPPASPIMSPIITLIVGHDQRFFVAHEDLLFRSPFFATILQDQFVDDGNDDNLNKAVVLPDEEPEILSCVLEWLYKGDYTPQLLRRQTPGEGQAEWELEHASDPNNTGGHGSSHATFFHSGIGEVVLRDTAVYCAAERYGLEELKRLALRKQGLQSGIPIDVILRSARYAYDNTPESEFRLRAHYLAMIIRTRQIFKSSGTMQLEMESGHKIFFDLFVAMCNHMDDLQEFSGPEFPKMV